MVCLCLPGDLHQSIEKQKGKPFEQDVIIDWFVQICFALRYIHRLNILHRGRLPHSSHQCGSRDGPHLFKFEDENFYGSGRTFGSIETNVNNYLIIIWVKKSYETHRD